MTAPLGSVSSQVQLPLPALAGSGGRLEGSGAAFPAYRILHNVAGVGSHPNLACQFTEFRPLSCLLVVRVVVGPDAVDDLSSGIFGA